MTNTWRNTARTRLRTMAPLLIGCALSLTLGSLLWKPFYFVFSYFGLVITLGGILGARSKDKDLSRRIAITAIAIVFVAYFGFMQRENMQIEETVFYFAFFLATGAFTRVLIHFCIAKVFGPVIWGRGFCGWACWTAAALEWLPIKENRRIPKKLGYVRIVSLVVSLAVPLLAIAFGYDYLHAHIEGNGSPLIQTAKKDQFLWFVASNLVYYALGVVLAFAFGKKRAFCKIACPVSLVMKAPTKLALLKVRPTGKTCVKCGACDRHCPMDVEVMACISRGKAVASSECIVCGLCARVCPAGAIR